MTGQQPRLLTLAQAAAWARVSARTMTTWVSGDLLPAIQDGNTKYIRLDHLQQLIRDRAQSPGGRLPRHTVTRHNGDGSTSD